MVILWDKMPLSKALAMSLQTAQRGGKLPPRCLLCSGHCSRQTRGKPAVDIFRLLVMITVFLDLIPKSIDFSKVFGYNISNRIREGVYADRKERIFRQTARMEG